MDLEAPIKPGLYPLKVKNPDGRHARRFFRLSSWCRATPCATACSTTFRSAFYPETPLKGNPIYVAPKGFIEVTRENEDTKVSPNFRIKEFLTKQKSGYPKYLVLDERLVYPARSDRRASRARGWDADDIFVMSGYRTPFYNKQLDDTKYSLHQWGRAADIFLDKDGNGMMDDFNKDKVVTKEDAVALANVLEGSPRPRSSRRLSAGSAFTAPTSLTDRSCTSTPARGEHGGRSLVFRRFTSFLVVLDLFFGVDFVVFQVQIDLVDPRVVFVPEAGVFVDAEHASAESLLERAAGLSFLIAVLREVRSAAPLRRLVRTEIPVGVAASRLTVGPPSADGGPPPIGGRGPPPIGGRGAENPPAPIGGRASRGRASLTDSGRPLNGWPWSC